ncbi:hypothetical protein CSC82_17910 [Rhodobacteraceae bacterium 4F10]|nr:hypothetical protein CSC82_17910 [Rhodobacteraceae bacterium 4F10]
MIGGKHLLLCGVVAPFAASADVTFPPHEVVGWDDAANATIMQWGHLGRHHTEMGGLYVRATPDRMETHDGMVYDIVLKSEFKNRLPKTKNEYHEARMLQRCDAWNEAKMVRDDLCGNGGTQ